MAPDADTDGLEWCYLDAMESCSDATQGEGGPWSTSPCGEWIEPGNAAGWGSFGGDNGPKSCPDGMVICGLRMKIEHNQGGGDDTALNNLDAMCCTPKFLDGYDTEGTKTGHGLVDLF